MADDSLARQFGRASAQTDLDVSVPGWFRVAGYVAILSVLLLALVGVSAWSVLGVAALILGIASAYSAVEIVQPYERRAYSLVGEYRGLLGEGFHLVPPFVSRTTSFDLRTQTLDVPRQEAITRDNSPVTADAVVYLRVTDPERAFLEVDDYERATSMLAQTTLRAVIGDMELDETLSQRERINGRIREELDGPTDQWGVRVEAVEVREVTPSRDVTAAMEEQSGAERRRRAAILEAQGRRRSAVETARGDRESNVIRAQGEKRASVLSAQGDAIATALRARAAESMGERAIVDKGLEALAEIGESPSTTFLIPQELTSLVGRYGEGLTGSDVADRPGLESLAFDEETSELLGLDEVDDIAAGVGAPAPNEAVANGDADEHERVADVDVDLNIDEAGERGE
jgi:regulator of protease activity HflC (stomatin/prohibitin superfamily)